MLILFPLAAPIAFQNIKNNTYTVFAVLNAAIFVSTYFIFPETAGRSLEEMSVIFEKASVWNPYDVVRIEKRTPRRYDLQGNLLDPNVQIENGFEEAVEEAADGRGAAEKEKRTSVDLGTSSRQSSEQRA